MDLETPHAVANRYRKLLINAQHGSFALVSLVSITQRQKNAEFPLKRVNIDSPLSIGP